MRGILIDVTRCRGCNRCVEACTKANLGGAAPATARFSREGLSATTRSTLTKVGEDRWVRQQCLHCLEPSCEAACLVGALHRTADGPVVYDSDKCIGCRYCMLACPFSVPRYEWKKTRPFVVKCEMCNDRPGGPACAEACPYGAVTTGERDDLLTRARERIRKSPDRYIDRIWGEKDAGGTGVMFLSDVSLAPLWPTALGRESVPDLTWPVVETTPWLFAGVGTTVATLAWIVHRRDRLAAEGREE